MLTRLRVKGFKNLVDVDVHFGPFTCIAGANGVGKSNLFDAIRFLSALSDQPFMEAARLVRGGSGAVGGVRALFHRVGPRIDDRMCFVADMVVPPDGVDDWGVRAAAHTRFVRYTLELGYRLEGSGTLGGNSNW